MKYESPDSRKKGPKEKSGNQKDSDPVPLHESAPPAKLHKNSPAEAAENPYNIFLRILHFAFRRFPGPALSSTG